MDSFIKICLVCILMWEMNHDWNNFKCVIHFTFSEDIAARVRWKYLPGCLVPGFWIVIQLFCLMDNNFKVGSVFRQFHTLVKIDKDLHAFLKGMLIVGDVFAL